MTSQVFPELIGLGFDVSRSPMWEGSERITSISGKETSIAYQATPRWDWELRYDFLRSRPDKAEFQQLVGFFNQMKGPFEDFLYNDPDDNSVVSQHFGTGDGVSRSFQLVRALGGFVEPVLAPNVISQVLVNGIPTPDFVVGDWDSDAPGVITFASIPGSGDSLIATFTFYWPARFLDNTLSFSKFMNQLWSGKSVKFRSVK